MLRKILIAFLLLLSVRAYSQETDSLVDLSKIAFNVDNADFKTLLDSSYYYSNTNPKLAIFFGLKALDKMSDNTDIYHKGKLLVTLGRSYHDLGDYSKAINYYFDELKLYHGNNGEYDKYIISTSINIGEAYRAAVDLHSALLHLNKAINLINKSGIKNNLPFALDRLASVYFEIGITNHDTTAILKSISYADSSLKLSRLEQDTGTMCSCLNIIGACYAYLGNFKTAIQKYSEAESYYPRDEINRSNLLNNIANAYYLLDDMDNAIKYATQSYNLAKPKGIIVYLKEATHILSKAHKKKGNYQLAFLFLDEYSSHTFKLSNDENRSKLFIAERKYESEKNKKLFEDEKKTKLYLISFFALFAISGITAFYLRQRYYKKQNLLLNELNQTKSKFISILSHDLRSPFTGINGLLEVLYSEYETLTDEERKDFIANVYGSTKNIYSLIENLLQWTKFQQGRYELSPEIINLSEIVNSVKNLQHINALNKKLKIIINIDPSLKVKADKNFLKVIIRNLFDNAIKYSFESGTISLTAKPIDSCIEITVTDTGIGMNSEALSKLFKTEHHLSTLGTYDETGSGLGLLLVKEMVEKSGGNIYATSSPNIGTSFIFTIPAA